MAAWLSGFHFVCRFLAESAKWRFSSLWLTFRGHKSCSRGFPLSRLLRHSIVLLLTRWNNHVHKWIHAYIELSCKTTTTCFRVLTGFLRRDRVRKRDVTGISRIGRKSNLPSYLSKLLFFFHERDSLAKRKMFYYCYRCFDDAIQLPLSPPVWRGFSRVSLNGWKVAGWETA